MVTAVFSLEGELTPFLRMRTKGIAKSLGKCMSIEELLPYYGKSYRWNGRVTLLTGSSEAAVSAHGSRTILS